MYSKELAVNMDWLAPASYRLQYIVSEDNDLQAGQVGFVPSNGW
jgi:hypothetical protein